MRADRAVVAGDPHQLPPTSFFSTSGGEDDEETETESLGVPAGTRNMDPSSTSWAHCSRRLRGPGR
jgi:hypothetical protein